MFGAYPQIASYMQSANDIYLENNKFQERLPAYLRPSFKSRQPWNLGRGKDGLLEDFIMVAEFSELEGPKPVMTIPKYGGANFDQNAFSVRIMAVDCQNSTIEFSVTDDAQIVMSDKKTGVFAFVHHLVLNDNTARGYVRPYCIAYITTDKRKLMHFYEDFSLQFKKAAKYLKYGNRLLFVRDLERHLKDLEYTKNVLLCQVSKIRLKNNEKNGKSKNMQKNVEQDLYKALHTIQESNVEIKKILSTLKPLLTNRRLEARFRLLEERAYQRISPSGQIRQTLQESWYNDLSALDNAVFKSGTFTESKISSLALFESREYKPVLVKMKKVRRFNAPLRGLYELSSWGAKEGVRKLGCIHKYFKRDTIVLELERNESRLFHPKSSSVSFGQCITGNLLSDIHMNKYDVPGEIEHGWSILNSCHWNSMRPQESPNSFKSVVSCPPSLNSLQEASPSSYCTYASLGSHIFHSAASSPDEEFSLLANNEYYLDLDNDADEEDPLDKWSSSTSLSQNEEADGDDLKEKTKISDIRDYVPGCGDEAAVNTEFNIQTSPQAVSENVMNNDNHNFNTNLPSVSLNFPDLNFFRKDTVESKPNFNKETDEEETIMSETRNDVLMEYKLGVHKPEIAIRTLVKTRGLSLVSKNSDLDSEGDTTNKHSANMHSQNLHNKCNCSALKLNYYDQNDSVVDASDAEDLVGGSLKKSVPIDALYNTTNNKAPPPKNVNENNTVVDSCTPMNDLKYEQFVLLSRKIQSVLPNDCKIVNVSSDNIQQVLMEHSINFYAQMKSSAENRDSSEMLEPEHSINFHAQMISNSKHGDSSEKLDPVYSINCHAETISNAENGDSSEMLNLEETILNHNSIGQTSPVPISDTTSSSNVPSLWLSENRNMYTHKSSIHSKCEIVNQKIKNHGIKGYSKQLSSFLSQKYYAHQITGKAHLENGMNNQDGFSHEIFSDKIRTESDVSSALTTSSIQDIYPRLEDVRAESPELSDNFQTHNLSERCETTEKDFAGVFPSHNDGVWKPRCGVYTVGDWVNNLAFGRPGFCLSEVLSTYQNLEHVIYSLLSGRPVLIVGPARLEQDVVKLVSALAVFVPETRRNSPGVLEWTAQCLKITDLTKFKLVGMCRPERRSAESFIPSAIKRACSIVDIEKRIITAPLYQGQLIMALLSKRKALKSDIQLLSYVEWWLMDILAKAFLFFHSFCLGPAGSILYSHSPKDQRDAYCATVCSVMFWLGVKDPDCDIVEYLAELVEVSELQHHALDSLESGNVVQPLTLKHKSCEKFRC